MGTKPKHIARAHYTTRIANRICENIAMGDSVKKALDKEPLGPTCMTFWRWLDMYPAFREKYERARIMQADMHADTMMDMAERVLANPRNASAFRVAADILQWQASMRNPKLYGSRVTVESKAPVMNADELKKEIAALEKELNVDTTSTRRSRDLNHEDVPAAQPDPNSDIENPKPSLFDETIGPMQ